MPKKGFTLIELLIVITMILLMVGLAIPFYGNQVNRSNVETTALELQQNLRTAKTKALSGESNSAWGVYIDSDKYILYQGSSYASRNTAYDQITQTEGTVVLTGLSEINFSKVKALPDNTGVINVLGAEAETLQLLINDFGRIYIQ